MKNYKLDIDLNVDGVYGLRSEKAKEIIIGMIKENFNDVEITYIDHNEISNLTSILFNFKAENLHEAKLGLLKLYVEDEFNMINDYEEAFETYVVNDAFEDYE